MAEWDGKARYRDFEYTGNRKITWAKIDPYDEIDLDVNRINNSAAKTNEFKVQRRMADKFIFLMQMMISLVTI